MDLSPADAIKKYNLPLTTKPIEPKELEEASYILIRHGLSDFNYAALVAKEQFGVGSPEFRAVETNPNGEDPELHPVGILQCESHQDSINAVEWKTVFTSPMQRALMTTIHMFKNHPNKDNINFVVLPIAREVLHTVCDIAIDPETLMDKFSLDKPICHGIKFDFSRMYLYGIPDLWQLYTLANVSKQKEVISQLRKVSGDCI